MLLKSCFVAFLVILAACKSRSQSGLSNNTNKSALTCTNVKAEATFPESAYKKISEEKVVELLGKLHSKEIPASLKDAYEEELVKLGPALLDSKAFKAAFDVDFTKQASYRREQRVKDEIEKSYSGISQHEFLTTFKNQLQGIQEGLDTDTYNVAFKDKLTDSVEDQVNGSGLSFTAFANALSDDDLEPNEESKQLITRLQADFDSKMQNIPYKVFNVSRENYSNMTGEQQDVVKITVKQKAGAMSSDVEKALLRFNDALIQHKTKEVRQAVNKVSAEFCQVHDVTPRNVLGGTLETPIVDRKIAVVSSLYPVTMNYVYTFRFFETKPYNIVRRDGYPVIIEINNLQIPYVGRGVGSDERAFGYLRESLCDAAEGDSKVAKLSAEAKGLLECEKLRR